MPLRTTRGTLIGLNKPVQLLLIMSSLSWLLPAQAEQSISLKSAAISPLNLQQAERLALINEQGTLALQARADALGNEAVAAAQLPDPELQLNALSVPTDTFSLSQEPMTQLQFSVSQILPAKGSLQAKQGVAERQSQAVSELARERQLSVLKMVRWQWLELYYWQQAKQLTQASQSSFQQLLNVVTSLYTVGKKSQYDLFKAKLELSKINNQLVSIDDHIAQQHSQLARWLGIDAQRVSAVELPDWQIGDAAKIKLLAHPSIRSLNEQVNAQQHQIDLAKSAYQPTWKVNLSYGHRDEDMNGRNLPDFLSAGVSVKLPLFPDKRQDKTYRASVQRHQSSISVQQARLLDMQADLQQSLSEEGYLQQRLTLYQTTILTQAALQAEASLKAYQSDRGNFSDVTDAVLAEFSLKLEAVRLQVDHFKQLALIKYFTQYDELKELAP